MDRLAEQDESVREHWLQMKSMMQTSKSSCSAGSHMSFSEEPFADDEHPPVHSGYDEVAEDVGGHEMHDDAGSDDAAAVNMVDLMRSHPKGVAISGIKMLYVAAYGCPL